MQYWRVFTSELTCFTSCLHALLQLLTCSTYYSTVVQSEAASSLLSEQWAPLCCCWTAMIKQEEEMMTWGELRATCMHRMRGVRVWKSLDFLYKSKTSSKLRLECFCVQQHACIYFFTCVIKYSPQDPVLVSYVVSQALCIDR